MGYWDLLLAIQGEHILSGSAASFVARARQEGRLPGGLEAWSSKDLSFARALLLICAARVHIMYLNYSILGDCKPLKNKGWESVYLEGSATEIFWIRQRWTSFYRRNIKFSSKCGFQTTWIGRAERWLCPGDVSVDCQTAMLVQSISWVASPSLSIHRTTAAPEGLWGGESSPWELTRCLVSQSPCPAGAQQWLWEQIPNITGADTKRQLSYSSTDKALSSSRQQTSKKDVPVVGCQRKKREKISRDLENMTEETFI